MTEIAFKTKSAAVGLFAGMTLFIALFVLSITMKPDMWILYFIISVTFSVAFLSGFCFECKKPDCLIKYSGNVLFVYAGKVWKEIEISDIISIKSRRTKSGRIVLKSGTIEIETKVSSYKLSNVKDVEEVTYKLRTIKQTEI